VGRIVWLASYPKSGNTWLRIFLSNLQHGTLIPTDINRLELGGVATDRYNTDLALGIESSDLTPDEIDRLRPAVYRCLANRSSERLFVKVHDAYALNDEGYLLFPPDITDAAIYVVRNPLDLCISFAHHAAMTIDEAIARMGNTEMALAGGYDRLYPQLRHKLLTWSQHVVSWLDQKDTRIHLMRYEDMCGEPAREFARAARFLGLETDPERIDRAIAFSSFEVLREQELQHGFREKPSGVSLFFRSGRSGVWRGVLTERQVGQLVHDHGPAMYRLGYLTESGYPR
jgi:aryl sulfotransferase